MVVSPETLPQVMVGGIPTDCSQLHSPSYTSLTSTIPIISCWLMPWWPVKDQRFHGDSKGNHRGWEKRWSVVVLKRFPFTISTTSTPSTKIAAYYPSPYQLLSNCGPTPGTVVRGVEDGASTFSWQVWFGHNWCLLIRAILTISSPRSPTTSGVLGG